jgi:carbonic anhydrase
MHRCDALVIHCIDFRFHEATRDFVWQTLGLKSYDLLTIPGAAKHLTVAGSADRRRGLLEDIGISLELHKPTAIIVINHADCGAYGGVAAFTSTDAETVVHHAALREAAALLHEQFPNVSIQVAYARFHQGAISVALFPDS